MRRSLSATLLNDALTTVEEAAGGGAVLNISALAEQVRSRNNAENVALEDIIHAMMRQAQWLNLSIEFGAD